MQPATGMTSFVRDLKFACRMLGKRPGTTGLILLTWGLGIGASVTLFSLVDALYVRPLNVSAPSRLVHGYQTRPDAADPAPMSLSDYFYYREHAKSFQELAAHYPSSPMHVLVDGEPVSITGSVVTASYFRVLRLIPHLGRFFGPDEDAVRDREAVAVISHRFWQGQLGGDPAVIGRSISINGRPFAVIGVAPPGFDGVVRGGSVSEAWIPSAMFGVGYRYCDAFARDCTVVDLLGRLQPTVSIEAARSEIDVLAR